MQLQIIIFNPKYIKSLITRDKDKLDHLANQNVYKISCKDCKLCWTTKRKLKQMNTFRILIKRLVLHR